MIQCTLLVRWARLMFKIRHSGDKWQRCEWEDERSYGGSREDTGHLSSSTLAIIVAHHRLMSVSSRERQHSALVRG